MAKRPKLPKRFSEHDQVPSEPMRVLSGKYETAAEIAKRTGLKLERVCDSIMKWAAAKQISCRRIGTTDCSIPVFKIAALYDTEH